MSMRATYALASGLAMALMSAHVLAATPLQNIEDAKKLTSQGHIKAAFDKTERAETGLLNEQQAGDKSNQPVLDDVRKAHEDLAQKDRKAAMSDFDSAISASSGDTNADTAQ
jgi:hypothetical protein